MKQETNFEIGINLCLTTWIYKIKERIQKSKETEDSQYIYQNELVKACFQHDIACEDFKDLARTTTSDKILGEHLVLLKIQKMMDIKGGLLHWFMFR